MSHIKVGPEDLHALSQSVRTGSEQIQEQLSRLQNDVTRLVGGEWMGAASGAFHQRYEEWNTSAAGLRDALDGIASLLSSSGTQYQMTEDHIRGAFG
jgi:WXG100 family type VII secretion target